MGNSISNLTRSDTFDASTLIAVSQNGQDYSVLPAPMATYLESLVTATSSPNIQYSAPSATGFTVTITDASDSVWLVLTPLAGYAAGTITLPAVGNSVSNQEVLVNCTQAVTALTVSGNGATVAGAPTALAANAFFRLKFEPVLKTWYRVG
jgi:hypothetical protein